MNVKILLIWNFEILIYLIEYNYLGGNFLKYDFYHLLG